MSLTQLPPESRLAALADDRRAATGAPLAWQTAGSREPEAGPPLLLSVVLRHWGWLALIALASAAVGYGAAQRFGQDSATTRATLVFTGLPGAAKSGVYQPLGPKTCSELLTSYTVLQEALAARGLDMPTTTFVELLTVELSRLSDLINVELEWGNAEEGISVLNELLDVFVRYVAEMRRSTLAQHIKHIESALLEARANVDGARARIQQLRRQQQESRVEQGGLNSDVYRSLLDNASDTQLAIDERQVQALGIDQQIESLNRKIADLEDSRTDLETQIRADLVDDTTTLLESLRDEYSPDSSAHADVDALLGEVAQFGGEESDLELENWHGELMRIVNEATRPLTATEAAELAAAHENVLARSLPKLREMESQANSLKRRQDELQLTAIPVRNQIAMLQTRLQDYQRQAAEVGSQLTGVDSNLFEDYESRLQEAEAQQQTLSLQLEGMRQLEKCEVSEWTISAPASMETTQLASNRVKVAALAFVLCGLTLSSPLVLAEWLRQRVPPQTAFARTQGLPIVAEQVLLRLQPARRGELPDRLPAEQSEEIRKLALRLQQTVRPAGAGATVLFSSLDPRTSTAGLIAATARCLAEREERVLVIDAVSAVEKDAPRLANLLSSPLPPAGEAPSESGGDVPRQRQPGLSDFFTAECTSLEELAHPTGLPGVDVVESGGEAPREAMASQCLTRLIEESASRYSMVLLHGPSAARSVDLQMLAARCDGVVLAASRSAASDSRARALVADLIDARAPIVGVVT